MSQQGHWRKLPPNQQGEGRFGEKTFGKTWVDQKENKSTLDAKEKKQVPSPRFVGKKGDFFAFAVPGGRYMFVVHESQAKTFSELVSKDGWQNSKETKAFMQAAESKGMFGIFKTDQAVIGY